MRRPSAEFQQPTGAYPPHLPHASASGPVQRHGAARFPSASSPTASHPGASPSFATSPNPPFAPGLSLGSVDPSIAPGAPEAKTADPGARRHAPRTPMGRVQAAWDGMSPNARIASVVGAMVIAIVLLWAVVRDPDSLFMVAEAVHFVGLALLIWKISAKRSVAGLSLGMQVMTALFLGVRFYCSLRMEVNWSQPLSGEWPMNVHWRHPCRG